MPEPHKPSPNERIADALEAAVGIQERREQRETAIDHRVAQPGAQGEPRKFTFRSFMRAIPGLGELFVGRQVPGEFWSLDAGNAEVACPCGDTPCVPSGVSKTCACGRAYLFDGEVVWVAFSPKDQPEPVDQQTSAAS